MTNLSKLKVSLTKHGIHKLAKLIVLHRSADIMKNLWGQHPGIKIDGAQVSSVLSIDQQGNIPKLWDDIRILGEEDIQDIVFIAIIFSHFKLIETFQDAIQNNCVINRGKVIDGKAFTNFAHTIDQFKYSVIHNTSYVSFDISRIYHKDYLVEYIKSVLELKLRHAGWLGEDIIQESLNNDFNKVFGLSDTEYRNWLGNAITPKSSSISNVKAKRNFAAGINFRTGHTPKFTGTTTASNSKKVNVTFSHNHMQNALFDLLNKKHPDSVGTEVMANSGSIDLVVKIGRKYDLYEIKTSNSSRVNIRQGLSQVLEYAFWGSSISINELIIVGKPKPSKESVQYLKLLRDRFNIPIFYRSLDTNRNTLSQKY